MLRELLPSRRVLWNGNAFTTNRWGMRDQDYPREKSPGTLRIALLGPSHVMGNGVADDATFESLLEQRLNRDLRSPRYRRVEVLNFGVDGYSLPQQVALLEDRVFQFHPDVVIATHYQSNRAMTEGFLTKVVFQGLQVPDDRLKALLARAGLLDTGRGGLPVPFAGGRALAHRLGIETRMPSVEAESRIRWISDDVLEWAFRRFAESTRSQGVLPVVLALNTVIDNVAAEIPNRKLIDELGLPVFDLFDVFPEAERPSLRVAPWDDHPNAAGHRLIADRVYTSIVALLDSGRLERQSADGDQASANGRF
jgi:hypothetical protein